MAECYYGELRSCATKWTAYLLWLSQRSLQLKWKDERSFPYIPWKAV
ncbi:hypothetical protein Patl1_31642 [Pistacia atlantica]|uniref:Uncharacterized protein n=1 Tax=Pistacia atlantica TaxID=434234 RepID=A0ACC1ANQ1_9ROSI|nr:hypothetical protein Patl1_31642 [Pistacia atlantica]